MNVALTDASATSKRLCKKCAGELSVVCEIRCAHVLERRRILYTCDVCGEPLELLVTPFGTETISMESRAGAGPIAVS